MTDYVTWNMPEEIQEDFISDIKQNLSSFIGENVRFDNGCYILNNGKIFKNGHWNEYNSNLFNLDPDIPRTRVVYLQKYRGLMFKFQKRKRAPEGWVDLEKRPPDNSVYGWEALFANSAPDPQGLYFNKGHIVGAKLLLFATRFKCERPMNFVPLTNWANRANGELSKGMQFFESELLDWLKQLTSSEKIFYRVTPIFLNEELVPRAIVLEGKLICKSNPRVRPSRLNKTEFNVLIPNTQKNLDIEYGDSVGFEIKQE